MRRKLLAVRLREVREKRGYKQVDLARRTGIPPSAVSQFETGRREPSLRTVSKLADALGVTVDFLCGRPVQEASRGEVRDLLGYARGMRSRDLKVLLEFAAFLARKQN